MIVHLDADAFFASVEQAADPKLRRRAVVVGGSKRGVVASASYEARRLGIFTTMPTARARKICPSLVVIPGDFEKYETFSRLMFSYAYDHTPMVEVASIDEGYFDVSGNTKMSAVAIAETIRTAIRQTLRISVSEGVGSNKLVSAIASKLKKPSAFLEVPAGREREFLCPLENKWLPGVGPKLARILDQAGLAHIGQIALLRPQQLSLFAGNQARSLWEFSQGIDERPVVPEAPAAKSYSEQETFERDVTDESWVLAKLRSIADRLVAKIRKEGKTIRTVEVRLRYNDFDECRRSASLREPTDLEDDIYPLLSRLMRQAWERRVSLRLVSVKLSGVYDGIFQAGLPLLDAGPDPAGRRRLAGVVDVLRGKFGTAACLRGHDLYLQKYGEPKPPPSRNIRPATSAGWVPLNFRSGYSFLDSLLKPADIVRLAVARGHQAVAICDPNLHGAIEFYRAAKEAGIRPIIGAEVRVAGEPLCAYVQDQAGYQNLCALLTSEKVTREFFESHRRGLVIRPGGHQPAIRYARPHDRAMYQVLSSIRTLTLLDARASDPTPAHYPPGPLELNAGDSLAIADSCGFEFELGGLKFPRFIPPDGSSPTAFLRRLTLEGARRRYGAPPPAILAQIDEELAIVAAVGYEEYFLLTHDLLWNACHPAGIEWITRGSAADSLVCYCLGISDVCPVRFELYFKRFLNRDRMALNKLPDIDLDFPHDRKDDVIDLIFKKFGDRAAIVGGFNTFQGRSAFADIAKVMGVSEFQIRRMTEHMPYAGAARIEESVAASRECQDGTWDEDPYQTALQLARHLDGMPRHPKMHPCGVVLSREPIASLTPLFTANKGWATTHFDMEAVEAIGLVKMDILAQGGLAVMRDTKSLLAERGVAVDLKALEPWADPEIWDMISAGGARGVHHIESPAMLGLSKMVGVRTIDDLIAIVSVIRPGAANSLKKETFARRARGLEPVDYTHPSLAECLRTTYGVVAYEEHILQICEAFAGLPGGRADVLRRALVKAHSEKVAALEKEFAESARARGRTPEEIRAVWALVSGFQGYAFCRAHSTAYGIEAYQAAHLKRNFPVEFFAAVLTNGKGFYNRLVYSLECRRLGIGFALPDINRSQAGFYPESGMIRVPLPAIKGLSQRTIAAWAAGKPFASMRDFFLRCEPGPDDMTALIRVGAFDGFGARRTSQFWEFRELPQWGRGTLFPAAGALPEIPLNEPGHLDHLRDEQELLGFPVSGHPLDLFPGIAWASYCPVSDLAHFCGQRVTVCGLIIESRIHRQADGRNMKFLSVCDYSGILECELFSSSYQRFGTETVRHPVVEITGTVTRNEPGAGHSLRISRIRRPRAQDG